MINYQAAVFKFNFVTLSNYIKQYERPQMSLASKMVFRSTKLKGRMPCMKTCTVQSRISCMVHPLDYSSCILNTCTYVTVYTPQDGSKGTKFLKKKVM